VAHVPAGQAESILANRMLIVGERHLHVVLERYIDHCTVDAATKATEWNCGRPATTRT
jgi:hypothetical protein